MYPVVFLIPLKEKNYYRLYDQHIEYFFFTTTVVNRFLIVSNPAVPHRQQFFILFDIFFFFLRLGGFLYIYWLSVYTRDGIFFVDMLQVIPFNWSYSQSWKLYFFSSIYDAKQRDAAVRLFVGERFCWVMDDSHDSVVKHELCVAHSLWICIWKWL